MSEFFRALEQASKDRQQEIAAQRRTEGQSPSAPDAVATPIVTSAAVPAPAPVVTEPVAAAAAVTDDAPEGVDDRLVSLLSPNSFAAEQYRTLRHMIEQMHSQTGLAVVGVSSAGIGEGKTTTAVNLAGTLAQSRASRVLLIDMDLRRSAAAGQLGIRGIERKGVVDVILSGASLSDVVIELPMYNLSLLPAGERQAAPYDLLKSPRLQDMLTEARRQYDYVVIDTPPLIGVPDCRVLSGCVDGFLVVVRAHKTPMKMLGEALSVVDGAKILGLVFNRDDRPIAEMGYQAYVRAGAEPEGQSWTKAVRRVRNATRRATSDVVEG